MIKTSNFTSTDKKKPNLSSYLTYPARLPALLHSLHLSILCHRPSYSAKSHSISENLKQVA